MPPWPSSSSEWVFPSRSSSLNGGATVPGSSAAIACDPAMTLTILPPARYPRAPRAIAGHSEPHLAKPPRAGRVDSACGARDPRERRARSISSRTAICQTREQGDDLPQGCRPGAWRQNNGGSRSYPRMLRLWRHGLPARRWRSILKEPHLWERSTSP